MIGRALFGNPWIFNKNFARSADAIFCSHDNGEKNAPMSEKKFFEDDDYRTPERYWLHNDNGIPLAEKLSVMIEHSELFVKLLGNVKNFAVMKKHYKAYANGFPGAKELRIKLMESKDVNEVKQIVAEFLAK
jgi:tRNA-dihydrouridine synthase